MFSPEDQRVGRFVIELADSLDGRMTAKMAAGCARSLILLPTASKLHATACAQLLPRLIDSLTTSSSDVEGLDESRSIITQAVTTFATTQSPDRKAPIFTVVIAALLARAVRIGVGSYRETAARLLELAGNHQPAFRAVAMRLGPEQRSLLERILRDGQQIKQALRSDSEDEIGEHKIALKMDF